jgi:hypothetical protein
MAPPGPGGSIGPSTQAVADLPPFDPASTDTEHAYVIAAYAAPGHGIVLPAPGVHMADWLAEQPVDQIVSRGPVTRGDTSSLGTLTPPPDVVVLADLAGLVLSAEARPDPATQPPVQQEPPAQQEPPVYTNPPTTGGGIITPGASTVLCTANVVLYGLVATLAAPIPVLNIIIAAGGPVFAKTVCAYYDCLTDAACAQKVKDFVDQGMLGRGLSWQGIDATNALTASDPDTEANATGIADLILEALAQL